MAGVKSRFFAYFLQTEAFSLLRLRLLLLTLMATVLLHGQSSEQQEVLSKIDKLRAGAGLNVKDTVYIDLLNELAKTQRYYNTDSLLLVSEQALKHSRKASYKSGESVALLNLGDYYSDKGEFKKAISNYKESLKIAESINNENQVLRVLNNLSGEYGYMGDYANALNGYLEGAELAQKIGNKRMLSIMNEDIASLYASQKDYEQALEYYKIVKRINEEINQEVNSAETFSNMASLYADMGKLEYAMFNINTSIATFEKEGITDWLAYAYEVKGKIYLKQQKFKWALFWYNQSELLHQQLEDERGEIDLLNGMAEAYYGLEQDSISKRYALKAFAISNGINFLEGRQKCAKTLYKISKKNKEYDTALSYHEIYQHLSDTLSRSENQKSLTLLKTKVEHERQKANLIIENEKQLATQRSYVNAALAILLIFVTVTFLVHRSEKIQKNLNAELKAKTKDLEENELELTALNETKDKLFSIIAHDLRGPIGAFQGLLDLFRNGEMGKEEFIDFIPKLGHDIDHISFTLNNLLTWGQSQMNGSVTRPAVIPVENIVEDNFNLLSEIAEGKSIKLVSNVPSNTLAWVDGDQLDIVIRNLISNALKFTKANGLVSVAAQEKTDHWEIAVRDTGIGMPKETVDKIFSNNTNITTYGTNNEKGTGLGLSLCKEMVEKNNGTIWVDSVPQQGSCFYFTVPKAKSSYQKAG